MSEAVISNPDPGSIHAFFAAQVGSEHIAREVAIRGLMEWLSRRRPDAVLEVGSGIGTLTYACVTALDAIHPGGGYVLVGVEDNEFCRGRFDENLRGHRDKVTLVRDGGEIPAGIPEFQFVVIDGGTLDERYFSRLARRGVIYVEGSRAHQRVFLQEYFSSRGRAWIRANFRPVETGGYWIFQLDPTLPERIRFAVHNLYYRVRGRLRPLRPASD